MHDIGLRYTESIWKKRKTSTILWKRNMIWSEKKSRGRRKMQSNLSLPRWPKKFRFCPLWNLKAFSRTRIQFMPLELSILTEETDRTYVLLTSHLWSHILNGICKRHVTGMCSSFRQSKKQISTTKIFWNTWESWKEEFSNPKKGKTEPLATWRKQKSNWQKRLN